MCGIGKATSIIKLTDGKSNHLFFWIRRDFHPIDNRSNGIEGCSGREWSWDVPSSSLCRWHDFFLSERNQWFSSQCRVFFFMQRILFPTTNIREYTNISITFSHGPSKYSTFFISSVYAPQVMQMKHSEGFQKVSKTRPCRPNLTPSSSYLFKFSRQTKLEEKKAPFENVRSCLYMTRVQIFNQAQLMIVFENNKNHSWY